MSLLGLAQGLHFWANHGLGVTAPPTVPVAVHIMSDNVLVCNMAPPDLYGIQQQLFCSGSACLFALVLLGLFKQLFEYR